MKAADPATQADLHSHRDARRDARMLHEIIVIAVAVACFINILPNDFGHDDQKIAQFNEKITSPGQWRAIWTADYWSHSDAPPEHRDLLYRPVTLSLLRLTWQFGGGRSWPFHLVSILLHALAALLVVRLARRIEMRAASALFAGLLFAVLPIHTEVVASAVGQADLLVACGALAALLCHDSSLRARLPGKAWTWKSAAMMAAFVAMASKENGFAAVPLIVLFDAYRHQANRNGDSPPWFRGRTCVRLAYLAIPLIVCFALRHHALGGMLRQAPPATQTINVLVGASPWRHALGVVQLWGMYWAKTFVPITLCIEYSVNAVRLATSILDRHVLIGAVATLALGLFAVFHWRRGDRRPALLVTALVVSFAPVSNLFVLMRVFFAERAWYLPSVFVVLILGWMIGLFVTRPMFRWVAVTLLLAFTLRCWIRNAEWRDNATLYAAAYRDHPNSVQTLHLFGQWNVRHGDFDKGVELLIRSLEIDAGFVDARRTLGLALVERARWSEAIEQLRIADMQAPGHAPTRHAIEKATQAILAAGADARLNSLREKVVSDPDDLDALLTFARELREIGLTEQAWDALRAGEARFADRAAWRLDSAVTLVFLDRIDDAVRHYRAAVDLDPDATQPTIELAMLLLERRAPGDLDEARKLASRASSVAPRDPSVLACRAELEAASGNFSEAAKLYELAVEAMSPDDPRRTIFRERARTLGR